MLYPKQNYKIQCYKEVCLYYLRSSMDLLHCCLSISSSYRCRRHLRARMLPIISWFSLGWKVKQMHGKYQWLPSFLLSFFFFSKFYDQFYVFCWYLQITVANPRSWRLLSWQETKDPGENQSTVNALSLTFNTRKLVIKTVWIECILSWK